MTKKVISFKVPDDVESWLRDEAEKDCRSISSLILYFLKAVKEHGLPAAKGAKQ